MEMTTKGNSTFYESKCPKFNSLQRILTTNGSAHGTKRTEIHRVPAARIKAHQRISPI